MSLSKVLVSLTTPRMVWGNTVKSFVDMAKYMGERVDFNVVVGCEISVARNSACAETIKSGYKGLCMIDSDQTFPPDALEVLIQKDKDIIGYVIRASKVECLNMGNLVSDRPYQQNALREYPENSTFEVGWIGDGFIYIKREALLRIPYPWFNLHYTKDDKGRDWRLHSDFYFSLKAKEAGVSIWACSERKIGHLTVMEKFPPMNSEIKEK